jgi:hypothetical protein
VPVYNLRIAEYHTYFVGSAEWGFSVWTHNMCAKAAVPNDEPPANLPGFVQGGKASGLLKTAQGETPLMSGWQGPSAALPKGIPGMNIVTKSHVEAQAAAIMRQQALEDATLYINRIPCAGTTGCDAMLPRMLPEGASLRIIGPNGFDKVYVGLPD